MRGGWINKSKVGSYLIGEWKAGDTSITSSWKVHSTAIQNLRETVNELVKADQTKVKAGLITADQFFSKLNSILYQVTEEASTEFMYNKQDEQLEAEQVAGEFTDYETYVKEGDKKH
jgi:hypothetical protein